MAEEGGVTVCVRLRPLITRENEDLADNIHLAWKSEGSTVSQTDGTKSFTFDRVFHSEDSTREVYQGVAAPIIKSAVQGYNGTIFAYGQTASGKTYTILGTPDCPGILPIAIHDVFDTICRIPNREFLLRISYMEIHNETIQDLLCSNIKKKRPLVVREDINRTIFVEDLIEEVVVSPEEVLSWLQKGEKNRHYGETKMNDKSSRSHAIFRMIIESKEKDTSSSSCDGAVMVSHLNLVDLAGSERASQTGTEGIRFKEGCNINRSLFILGQVIKKLCDDQSGGFINYRDSKLTRILQNSLGGNAKTVIICTITPASLDETFSTLQFASTAKNMKNTPKVNEVLDDEALLKRYRKEIENLKRRLEEVSTHSHTKDEIAQLLEEKDSLQKQQEDKIRALTEMLVTSSSYSQEREAKARRKRRVTWAPGAISKEAGMCFVEELPSREKRCKFSLPALSEMEESMSSVLSEGDNPGFAAASVVQPKEEWISGSEMNFTAVDLVESVQLCESILEERDNAVFEQKAMERKLRNLQLENEQLQYELSELKEKRSNEEFEVLENETAKEHEMQLMHEISSLESRIQNAEVYNQELQEELRSKDLQLKEQESKINVLENKVAEQRNLIADLNAENENRDMSTSIAQVLETSSQTEKDLECCRRQLEAGKVMYKKMQTDLQKELQYYFQENAKLMSLLEDKVPKDLLSRIELERRIEDLKKELNKTQEQHTDLRKEVTELSEAASGHDLEIFQKEILEKSEIITSLSCEREGLLSQVAEKDRLLQEATDALKSEKDFANAEVMTEDDVAFEELKHHHDEISQKFIILSEESKQMKGKVDLLSGQNLELNKAVCNLTQEILEKSEIITSLSCEREGLLSQVAEKDRLLQEATDAIKSEKDFANAEVMTEDDVAFQELKHHHDEISQKFIIASEESKQMKGKVDLLSGQNLELNKAVCNLTQEILEKSEIITSLSCEREGLLSQVAEKDRLLQEATDALKSEKDFANAEVMTEDVAFQELKHHHDEISQKLLIASEESKQMKGKVDLLTGQNLELNKAVCNLTQELSLKIQELQDKEKKLEELHGLKQELRESQWEQNGLDQLEKEKAELAQKLETTMEDMRSVTMEKQNLKITLEDLQADNDRMIQTLHNLSATVNKTVSSNLQLQEQLQRAHSSVEEHTKTVAELKAEIVDKDSWASKLQETSLKQETATEMENLQAQIQQQEEKINSMKNIMDEKTHQHQKLESKYLEANEQLRKANLQLQEQLQCAHNAIEEHTKTMAELKAEIMDKDSSASKLQETLKQENLQLQEQLQCAHNAIEEHTKTVAELKAEIMDKDSSASKLQETLKQKFPETSVHDIQQDFIKGLDAKIVWIKEVLKTFSCLEERSECLKAVSLQIKCEFNHHKSVVAKALADLSPQQAKDVKRLQMEHDHITNSLYSLLNKLQKILKDISEMEEELGAIEEKLKQLQNGSNDSKQYFERCSNHFNIQDFEAGIKQDNERFMPVGQFLDPKTQAYVQARLELDKRNTDYCKETEIALKNCREQTKELLLELSTLKEEEKLKEKRNHSYDATLAQIEKNHKLEKELKAAEEDIKNLKLKILELENRGSEAERGLQAKEKRIAILQSEVNMRTSKSEVPKLKTALEEQENYLRSVLMEMETLKTKLSKGAEFYKEEIEDLKTKLVNADMARTKQSRLFDQEMENANALTEHKEQQLRKLKEELRKMQQDQDTTVSELSSKDLPQPPLAITCGGGSGIVQNTHLLLLKSEHAKLEKKYSQLQKEYEVVSANVIGLKEDVNKWKERALKMRAHFSRDVHEEQIPKSPTKTAPPSNTELPSSPFGKQILHPVLPPNTSTDSATESTENKLKHWIPTDEDCASNCKTQ